MEDLILETKIMFWISMVSSSVLFGLFMVMFVGLLRLLPHPISRFHMRRQSDSSKMHWLGIKTQQLIGIREGSPRMKQLGEKLNRAGLNMKPEVYECIRRLLVIGLSALCLFSYEAFKHPAMLLHIEPMYGLALSLSGIVFSLFHRHMLNGISRQRSERIVKEIYEISNQLLYYSGSKMNLHAKLARCVPFTRIMRPAMRLLLNEWYANSEAAIKRFKMRLGSDEAYSFAETIQSLSLFENERYYALLRERIQDYKEKIELAKDSKKETVSYMLFVLAGVPILNTFRIFLYPWVVEGQKLFQSIN